MAWHQLRDLAVADLGRSLAFYGAWMQLDDAGIRDGGDHAAITLPNGLSLVLYPRPDIAAMAALEPVPSASEFILSYEAPNLEAARQIIADGLAAGATQPEPTETAAWGLSAHLRDPDGHLWEIVCFTSN